LRLNRLNRLNLTQLLREGVVRERDHDKAIAAVREQVDHKVAEAREEVVELRIVNDSLRVQVAGLQVEKNPSKKNVDRVVATLVQKPKPELLAKPKPVSILKKPTTPTPSSLSSSSSSSSSLPIPTFLLLVVFLVAVTTALASAITPLQLCSPLSPFTHHPLPPPNGLKRTYDTPWWTSNARVKLSCSKILPTAESVEINESGEVKIYGVDNKVGLKRKGGSKVEVVGGLGLCVKGGGKMVCVK